MKKIVIVLGIALLLVALCGRNETVMATYYDYMCVVTENGDEYLLSDEQSADNPYMQWNSTYKCYMPIFQNGQTVKLVLNGNEIIAVY